MSRPERVFLIGPMGAGKTAVGRRIAALLHYRFVDADQHVEKQTGVDVGFIFDKEGEAGFRKREAAAIAELTEMERVVLATGGGAIMNPDTRRLLSERGLVVYLHTSVDQQYARTSASKTRPLLDDDDPRARLEELLEIRGPIYEALADLRVCTDRRYVKSVAREIFRSITESGSESCSKKS